MNPDSNASVATPVATPSAPVPTPVAPAPSFTAPKAPTAPTAQPSSKPNKAFGGKKNRTSPLAPKP